MTQAKNHRCIIHRSSIKALLSVQAKNHRRRIINRSSLSEFAYILKQGGLLYVVP